MNTLLVTPINMSADTQFTIAFALVAIVVYGGIGFILFTIARWAKGFFRRGS